MAFVSFNGNLVWVEVQNKTQEYKEHYIGTRHHSKCFIIIHSILIKTPMRVVYYNYLYFTDEKIEAPRG